MNMIEDKIKYVSRFLILVFMIFAIAACGGSGSGSGSDDVTAISGNAVKGPVRDAQVILLYFDDKGEEIELSAVNAPVKTNADGSFVFNVSADDVPDGPVLAILRTIGGQTGPDNGNAPMLESVITDLSGVVSRGSKLVSHMSTASSVAARLVKLKIVETGSVPDTATTNELLKRVEQQLDVDLDEDPGSATSSTAALNEEVDRLFALKATSANVDAASEYIDFLAANLASQSGELDEFMQDPANPGVDVAVSFGRIGNGALADLYSAGELQNRLLEALNIADLIGPSIVSAIATSNTEVIVTFTEELQGGQYGVEYVGNYVMVAEQVPGAAASSARVGIVSAELMGPSNLSVRLTTQSQTDIRYSLQVTSMVDLAGNPFRVPEKGLEGLDPSKIQVVGVAPRGCDDPDDPTCVSEIVNSDGDKLSDSDELRGWTVTTTTAGGVTTTYTVTSDPNTADTDNDGVPDDEEKHASSDPRSADTDGDTLTDNLEWNVLYSDPTNADTDGDGTQDGFEFIAYRTSPTLADTDGDQINDTDEILARNRSPRIADLPEAGIVVGEVRLQIDERYTYEDVKGDTVVVEDSSTSTLVQSEDKTFATSQSALIEDIDQFYAEGGFESEEGRGLALNLTTSAVKGGPFFLAGGGYEDTTSNTFSTDNSSAIASQKVREQSLAKSQQFDSTSAVTREIIGARIDVDLSIFNRGNIAFTISNIEVTMLQRDRQSTGRFIPVATLIANSTLLTGGFAVNDEAASFNLGPFNTERGPILFSSDTVFPNLVDQLMQAPGGLIFKVSNFDITDEFGRVFSYSSQIARDRTAGIIFDYGDGNLEQHLVATAPQYDGEIYGASSTRVIDGLPIVGGFTADGSPLGIPLDYALQAILKMPKGNADADGILAGPDGIVSSFAAGDDIQVIPPGTTGVTPRSVAIAPGANGVLNSTAFGDDTTDSTTGYETSMNCDANSPEPLRGNECAADTDCSDAVTAGFCAETLARVGYQRNGDFNRKWVLFTNQQNGTSPAGADFGQIMLSPGADLTIAFLQDLDEDGLFAREEYLAGSIDSRVDNYDNSEFGQVIDPTANDPTKSYRLASPVFGLKDDIPDSKDTDRDGIGDFAEVRVGWKVQQGAILKQTYSSPRLADSDGDGLLDPQEQDLRAFCAAGNDPRQDALCAFQTEGAVAQGDAIAIIAGPGGVANTEAAEGDVQLIAAGVAGLPYGAVIIGEGEQPGIQTTLGGNNLYDDGFSKPPATDPSLSDTDNDGISDRVELDGFTAGLSIRDGVGDLSNKQADTRANADDIQAARVGTPVIANGIIILPGPNGELDTIPIPSDILVPGSTVVTDPLREDTDGDSVIDGIELATGGDPTDEEDGVLFRDSDQDGISDSDEDLGWMVTATTPTSTINTRYKSNSSRPDSDFDGLPDFIERDLRTNPNNADTDGDGLSDFDEVSGALFERYLGLEDQFVRFSVNGSASQQYGSNPAHFDSDFDGLTDYEELIAGYLLLDPLSSAYRYIYTDPQRADTDFDGISDFDEKNRSVTRTIPRRLPVVLGDESLRWRDGNRNRFGTRPGAEVLCKAPCTVDGVSTSYTLSNIPYGFLSRGLGDDPDAVINNAYIDYRVGAVYVSVDEILVLETSTDATNPDTDGDGASDASDALPLIPDRNIEVIINSIAFSGPGPEFIFSAEIETEYSAGWWITVTSPDGETTLMSDALDLLSRNTSIVYKSNGELRKAAEAGPSVDEDNANGIDGSNCNAIRKLNRYDSYYLNLDRLGVANNPKSISLQEGESFRLDGVMTVFDERFPQDAGIAADCGRAPTYIPSSFEMFGTCVGRLNKTFNYDDFLTAGSQQDSLTVDAPGCSIELTYTLKR
jgi:hypothetical protein